MSRRVRLLSLVSAFVLSSVAGVVGFAPPATAQAELCGLNDTINISGGEQIVMNNVWGASTAQCIDVDQNTGDFEITLSEHNNQGGQVASYPVIFEGCHWDFCSGSGDLPLPVNDTQTAVSSWNIDTSNVSGTWNAAYDLWYHTNSDTARAPDGAELMIWLDRGGGAGPAGSQVAGNVPIAGATWNVYFAEFTDWNYIAYLRTSPTSSASDLDIDAFTQDAVSRGYIQPSWYLSAVEAGFELWQQGAGLASSGFSFAGQSGSGQPPTTPPPGGGDDCAPSYQVVNDWGSGFQSEITLTNLGTSTTNGWEVVLTFPGGQLLSQVWNGDWLPGDTIIIRNAPWNGAIPPGGSVSVGLIGSYTGANASPIITCAFS